MWFFGKSKETKKLLEQCEKDRKETERLIAEAEETLKLTDAILKRSDKDWEDHFNKIIETFNRVSKEEES